MENKALRVIFSLFVGVLIALLVGFGILALDPGPGQLEGIATNQQILAFRAAAEAYDREVSLAASTAALIPLVVSVVLPRRAVVIADGLLLGGIFTFIYGAARGMSSQATAASFAAAGIGLILALAAGYVRFAGWTRPGRPEAEGFEPPMADDRMMAVLFPLSAGVLTAFAAALGIQTFYPQPIAPIEVSAPEYDEAIRAWSRNLGIIATVIAVLLLVLSMVIERVAPVPGNALLLGGLFTLFYGVAPAIGFGQGATAFLVLAVALIVVLFVGYRRFGSRRPPRGTPAPKPPSANPPSANPPATA